MDEKKKFYWCIMDRRAMFPTGFFERKGDARSYAHEWNMRLNYPKDKPRFTIKRFLVVLKGVQLDFYEHSFLRSEKVDSNL